jgi:hypothetical protein
MYVNSALAKTEANLAGFDDGIILTPEGHVSEGAVTNTFVVVKGRLITPPPCDSILLGITRNTVMQLARNELGLYTIERSLVRSDLYAAEEVFFTGTYAGVVPIVEIDNRPVRTGDTGPLTARLKEMYTEVAFGRIRSTPTGKPSWKHNRPEHSAGHRERRCEMAGLRSNIRPRDNPLTGGPLARRPLPVAASASTRSLLSVAGKRSTSWPIQ